MDEIFTIKTETDFHEISLKTFHRQYKEVPVYRHFCDFLGRKPDAVTTLEQIPFLPIEIFKTHQVLDRSFMPDLYFQSSGTTQMTRSKHFIAAPQLYRDSIYHSFEQFIGAPEDYIFLGLLPNYSENSHSSLIYMVDFLMKASARPENGYFLYNHKELLATLTAASRQKKKVLLFGVSFALLDFLDFCKAQDINLPPANYLTVIETGGMKGRKKEMTKDELLLLLQAGFATKRIFSEYSMTELLSQAYSLGQNIYKTPNWMRILIRSTEDPFAFADHGRTGAINIIDLANRYSCSFIATQDLGRTVSEQIFLKDELQSHSFEILGRIDHSDIRGCSLLVS